MVTLVNEQSVPGNLFVKGLIEDKSGKNIFHILL